MDGFCEQVVKRKRKAKDNILAVVYIVMALLIPAVCISLAYVITAYFIYIGFFLLLALVPLALLLINYQKVEYEYSVVDNTLNVDKIIAKRRRKRLSDFVLTKSKKWLSLTRSIPARKSTNITLQLMMLMMMMFMPLHIIMRQGATLQ